MAKNMNEKMKEHAPELASEYARYPLKRDRWLGLSEKDPQGKPIFVPLNASTDTEMKMDYVRGAGPRGHGWYHLLNQHSYRNLHQRLRSSAPTQCCACTKAAREYYNDYSDVQTIVYNRSVASRPDDGVGSKEAIEISQTTAQGYPLYAFVRSLDPDDKLAVEECMTIRSKPTAKRQYALLKPLTTQLEFIR